MTDQPADPGDSVRAAAEYLLDQYERSGYGTTRPDRHMPNFNIADVTVARFVTEQSDGSEP